MKKVVIMCENFYDRVNMERLNVGGIESYIQSLVPVLLSKDLHPVIVQFADVDKIIHFDKYELHGVNIQNIEKYKAKKKKLLQYSLSLASADDILLYSTEDLISGNVPQKTIAIQHGIYWDKPVEKPKIKLMLVHIYGFISRTRFANCVDNVVCVDYNYLNWYRTIRLFKRSNFCVIPNFSKIPGEPVKDYNNTKIIFARRLVEYRGTRLFVKAIKKLTNEGERFDVLIAGEGPDETWIKKELKGFDHVKYTRYAADESLLVHKDKTIAVIPTLGSEGTSLSLLEAMASGCAVVATNVGGMTNIVIDNYNGLMVNPNEQELYSAIRRLIHDKDLCRQLGQKAYETVKIGFSYDLWQQKWENVIDRIISEEST